MQKRKPDFQARWAHDHYNSEIKRISQIDEPWVAGRIAAHRQRLERLEANWDFGAKQ